jgi:hypothetical protein
MRNQEAQAACKEGDNWGSQEERREQNLAWPGRNNEEENGLCQKVSPKIFAPTHKTTWQDYLQDIVTQRDVFLIGINQQSRLCKVAGEQSHISVVIVRVQLAWDFVTWDIT